MSPTHHVHPEFGLFCPSPRLRRKLRLGFALAVTAAMFATAGTIVLKAANDPAFNPEILSARGEDAEAASAPTLGPEPRSRSEADRPRRSAGSNKNREPQAPSLAPHHAAADRRHAEGSGRAGFYQGFWWGWLW